VPQHLTAASLALGRALADRHAGRAAYGEPGIFSAIMVGSAARGETMIVLMATGTRRSSTVPFNACGRSPRTLRSRSRRPLTGTLYRVLFLSACVLFLMTFFSTTSPSWCASACATSYKAI